MNIYFAILLQELPKLLTFCALLLISFLLGTIIKRYTQEELKQGKKYLTTTQTIIATISFLFLLLFFYKEATTSYFIVMLFLLPVFVGVSLYYQQISLYHALATALLPEFILLPALAIIANLISGSSKQTWKQQLITLLIGMIIGLLIRFSFLFYGTTLVLIA